MSKENKKLTIREQVKLYTVNFLLRILEKLLAKEIAKSPNPPINPNDRQAIEQAMKVKLGEKLDPVMFADPDLLSRDIDFAQPDENSDDAMSEIDIKIKDISCLDRHQTHPDRYLHRYHHNHLHHKTLLYNHPRQHPGCR